MKKILRWLIIISILFDQYAAAQTATITYPFSIGRTSCGSGTHELHYYTYNASTNALANASGGVVGTCTPVLKIGTTNFTFTSNASSISYNPKDHKIYYF